jgi:hypothetical protein
MIVGLQEEQIKEEANQLLSLGAKLAGDRNRVIYENMKEGKKVTMGALLDGIPRHSILESHTALMLNNTRNYFDSLDETTKLVNIGDFEKYAFPMVRVIFPNLAAHNLSSVQPMLGPVSLVFYMKFLYATTKGTAIAGQDIIEHPNQYYASEDVDSENRGTGTGASTVIGSGTLTFKPVKPGTVVFDTVVSGLPVQITDDGNGHLIGDIGGGTNTIVYATGVVVIDWVGNVDLGVVVTCSYSYDLEGNVDQVPDIDMQLTSSPVTARTRKLRTRWSLEAAQDLRNLHGLEAEVEQVAAISNELKFEIDREIINGMYGIAINTVTAWSKTPTTYVSYTEHKLSFIDKLTEASNAIFQATQRAVGTWLICGTNVASLIETLPGFVPSPRPRGTRAVYKCGVLNGQWDIWKDPNFGANLFMMGYQGDSMWEVGYIFAPYILAFTTATIMLDDFISRKGMASRYGKKSIDGRFFCLGSITA